MLVYISTQRSHLLFCTYLLFFFFFGFMVVANFLLVLNDSLVCPAYIFVISSKDFSRVQTKDSNELYDRTIRIVQSIKIWASCLDSSSTEPMIELFRLLLSLSSRTLILPFVQVQAWIVWTLLSGPNGSFRRSEEF